MVKDGQIAPWTIILSKNSEAQPKMYENVNLVVNNIEEAKSPQSFEKISIDCL